MDVLESIIRIPIIRKHIKRIPIFPRHPVVSSLEYSDFDRCYLYKSNTACDGCIFREPYYEGNPKEFRIVRVDSNLVSDEYWEEIYRQIEFIRSQKSFVRVISDCYIPKKIMFLLGYSSFNVVQFEFNLLLDDIKWLSNALVMAKNCGIYSSVVFYPVIPCVTKTQQIIEYFVRLQHNFRMVGFRFIQLPLDSKKCRGFYNIDRYFIPARFMEKIDSAIICNERFRRSFCTIIEMYLSPRKIGCHLCDDNICY